MTSAAELRRVSDALAALTALKDRLPGDYLIVGPHASYAYHHWMFPIAKMIHLRIRADDLEKWRALLREPWLTLDRIPTHDDTRAAVRLAVLETTLTETLHRRRRVINGLDFISPEDISLELLARASTQISLSEVAALLVARRADLDWDYLVVQATTAGLGARLRQIAQVLNREAGQPILPLEKMAGSSRPSSATATRRLDQLMSYLPPPLRPTARPRIASATAADVLRGLKATWAISDGR